MEDSTASNNISKHQDSRFSCNICLDPVTEPVVTRCGHLFCWPCLFQWLAPSIRPNEALSSWRDTTWTFPRQQYDDSRRCCPVCKAECSVPTLVPIYVRNEPGTPLQSTRKTSPRGEESKEQEQQQDSSPNVETTEETRENQPPQEQHSSCSPSSANQEETGTTTGLRQRLRFRSRDSEIPEFNQDEATATATSIPSRPAANSPARTTSTTRSNNNDDDNTLLVERPTMYANRPPLSPRQGSSLSQGMLLLFQQALHNSDVVGGTRNTTSHAARNGVPPLHYQPNNNNNNSSVDGGDESAAAGNAATTGSSVDAAAFPQHDDATEFLSRLLLILASFVILCLLLF